MSEVGRTHRILRVHGGRLVNADPRRDVESELDTQAAAGFLLAGTFVVDDNVYLVLRRDGAPESGSTPPVG